MREDERKEAQESYRNEIEEGSQQRTRSCVGDAPTDTGDGWVLSEFVAELGAVRWS